MRTPRVDANNADCYFTSAPDITIDVTKLDNYEVSPAYRAYSEFDGQYFPGLMHPASITLSVQPNVAARYIELWRKAQVINVLLPGDLRSKGYIESVTNMVDALSKVVIKLTGKPEPIRPTFLQSAIRGTMDKFTKDISRELQKSFSGVYIGDHPMCRSLPYLTMKERPVKIRNRFYVAAPSVTSPSEQSQDNTAKNVHLATRPSDRSGKWTRKDLKDAIAHAEQILEDDPSKEHVAVVRIVRVVRRKKMPAVVEVIK